MTLNELNDKIKNLNILEQNYNVTPVILKDEKGMNFDDELYATPRILYTPNGQKCVLYFSFRKSNMFEFNTFTIKTLADLIIMRHTILWNTAFNPDYLELETQTGCPIKDCYPHDLSNCIILAI